LFLNQLNTNHKATVIINEPDSQFKRFTLFLYLIPIGLINWLLSRN